jgi:transcriptional antiterminator Rof (Rho-off)
MSTLNKNGYIVRISENALISLILNALEAYCINHKNINTHDNIKLETFGNLFGYEMKLTDGKVVYQIEIANTDTSAKQKNSSVSYNREAISLKIDTITSFWPHLDYLGEFHSHPYDSHKEAKDIKGYYLSDNDRNDLTSNSEFWGKYRHRVGLLITIGPMLRSSSRETQWVNTNMNCVELNLGNFKIWLTAYCSYQKREKMFFTKDNDDLVTLDCPHLTGLQWEHTKYGRVKVTDTKVKFLPSN